MMEVEIFEFVHDIHTCYLEIFKEQEIEEKKISIFHCWVMKRVSKMEL